MTRLQLTGSNSADAIYAVVKKAKADLEARKIMVAALVGDNAASVQSALSWCFGSAGFVHRIHLLPHRMQGEDGVAIPIRCAAHSIQLLLGDVSDTPLVAAAMRTMEAILEECQDNNTQDRLKAMQCAAGKPLGKLPLKPVETRYSRCTFFLDCRLS